MNQSKYHTPQGGSLWSPNYSGNTTQHPYRTPSTSNLGHSTPVAGSYTVLGQDNWKQKVDHLKKFFGEEYDARKQFHSHGTPFVHSAQTTHNNHHQIYQHPSYQTMLESALQKNVIRERCDEVSKVLGMASVTELRDLFPTFLFDLFGYQSLPSWGLNYLEARSHHGDFQAMVQLMGPKGTIFKVIDRLMTDHEAVFQLPYEILPSGISEAIMKNQIPLWYQHKINTRPNGSIVVNLNALEYYFALFSHFVLHQRTLQLKNEWSSIEDVFYVHMFEMYLSEYLPVHGTNQQSSTISNVSPSSVLKQHGVMTSSLWRSPDLKFATQTPSSPSSHVDLLSHEPSKAETFLQIVADFWLTFNSEEYIQKKEEYKLPSLDHSRMVRILVKYLHTYSNASKNSGGVQGFGTNTNVLRAEDFEKVVIPSIVYNKLYSYLLHCFNHWPLDGTFRMILETWLSFIQPWRYQNNQVNVSTDDFDGDITNWKNFIDSNMDFYTDLLGVFLLRALKYDLTSLQDVQLIYRVAKVISQPALMEILHEGIKDNTGNRKLPGMTPYSSGLLNNSGRKHKFDSSGSPSLLTIDNNRHANELCQRISMTLIGIRHKILVAIDSKENKRNTWLGYIKEVLMLDEADDVCHKREEQRLVDYLKYTCTSFSEFFALSDFPMEPSPNINFENVETLNTSSGMPTPELYTDDTVPDHRVTEDGIVLTDRGRYQMIQGMRRFDIVYGGDPEFQPVRSYESPAMVRWLHRISAKLNAKYGEKLEGLYNRHDVIGTLLRRVTHQELHIQNYANSAIRIPTSRKAKTDLGYINPRITLRFAGSYYFLGYICWGIVLCRIFDVSWLAIILIFVLVAFVCILYHVDSPVKHVKNE